MAAAVNAIRKQKRAERESNEGQSRIQQAFDKYDEDGSGMMDKEELSSALEDLGMFVTPAQADAVLRKFGGGASELNREQFNLLVQELQKVQANLTPRSAARMSGTHRRGSPSGLSSYLPVWKHHEAALRVYTNKWMQMFVAVMILGSACAGPDPSTSGLQPALLRTPLGNPEVPTGSMPCAADFLVNIIEKEIDPYPAEMQLYKRYWDDFDVAFNIIFLFEIILNAWSCGGPYKKFWASGWNNFDFIVVAVGVLLMTSIIPPGSPLGNLKMMRAFRVFRLFKRIKSLNKVVMALITAIPGVTNAFIIMVRRRRCAVAAAASLPAISHLRPPSYAFVRFLMPSLAFSGDLHDDLRHPRRRILRPVRAGVRRGPNGWRGPVRHVRRLGRRRGARRLSAQQYD